MFQSKLNILLAVLRLQAIYLAGRSTFIEPEFHGNAATSRGYYFDYIWQTELNCQETHCAAGWHRARDYSSLCCWAYIISVLNVVSGPASKEVPEQDNRIIWIKIRSNNNGK